MGSQEEWICRKGYAQLIQSQNETIKVLTEVIVDLSTRAKLVHVMEKTTKEKESQPLG